MTFTHCCRWAALVTMTCTSPVLAQTAAPSRLITAYFNVDAGLASPSPSSLKLTARAVDGADSAEFWSASIDDVDLTNESAAAWGLHVGADGSYFFSRYVGVGGLVRYSRATVSLADPIRSLIEEDEVTTDVKAGGVQLLGGLRVRF